MKLKTILNGIAALLAVGMFYTFSFCMVRDVSEKDIGAGYSYTEDTADKKTESSEINTEDLSEKTFAAAETTDDTLSAPKAPLIMKVPSFAPSTEEMLLMKVGEDEVVDENYNENSYSYSGFSDDELDVIFPEEDDVNDYVKTSAETSAGKSSEISATQISTAMTEADNGDDSDFYGRSSAEEIRINGSGYSANDINLGNVPFAGTRKKSAPFPETAPMSSFDDVIDSSENGYNSYASFDENGCGESFTVKANGEIGEYDAYELVCMIVTNEMSPSFNMEALRAQAVAAYSYVRYHADRGLTASVLIKEDVPDRIKEAVSSVWGQCCYYNGQTAQTVYTASTSGYTADAVNVWGGDKVPYLVSKECPFDCEYDPNYGVEKIYSEDEIRNKLENYLGITLSDDPENWINVTGYIDGNYVSEIDIDGQAVISGIQMREKVLGYKIKSASFRVRYSDGEFIFTTYGYGHGVGMSQNGANILANQGYTYIDILKFYYEGITIS